MKLFKKGCFREEDYMYSSAKLAAMSLSLIGDDTLAALCACPGAPEMFSRLGESGITPEYTDGRPDIEKTLTGYLAGKYSVLSEFIPDKEPAQIMLARYDCHNLKAAIKCGVLGIDPAPFFIGCGSVPAADIAAMAESGDFSGLDEAMAEAAKAAREAAMSLAPARYADALLDAACFECMKRAADRLGCEPVSSLLSLKADLTNFVTALRILKFGNPETAADLRTDSFVTGGKIAASAFASAADRESALKLVSAVLGEEESEKLASVVASADIDGVGTACDRIFLCRAASVCAMRLTGIYPVIDYVIKLEYCVKNLRIIYYGLESGRDGASIGEELRTIV